MRANVRSPPPSAIAREEMDRAAMTNKVLIGFILVSSNVLVTPESTAEKLMILRGRA
jgi:hypothetical protein